MRAVAVLLLAARGAQMNAGAHYHIANPAEGYTGPWGFQGEHFEVDSPVIRSRYGDVVWKMLAPTPLPADVVARFNGSVMAVTGFEVDVRRKTASGWESVPAYQSYNHHYTMAITGGSAAAKKDPNWDPMMHKAPVEFVAQPWLRDDDVVPSVQSFNEHNGNEHRQSYHALPPGTAQIIRSPEAFHFNPMQINTNDGSGKRGGPLPRNSRAPPGAPYSGLLECPCTTRTKRSPGKINGYPYNPNCAPWPRSDLLNQKNPTCHADTYVGGIACCGDGTVLLDADQEQPAHVDEVYFTWRFYYEEFDAAKHVPTFHLEWDGAVGCDSGPPRGNPFGCNHIEYDVVQAPPGTPSASAVHVVTSRWQVKDMLVESCDVRLDPYCAMRGPAEKAGGVDLIMAGGHCHAPACLSMELINADTGELLCRIDSRLGSGDEVMNESGYLWLPPCQWGWDEARRAPPLLTLETNLTSIKRANSSAYHPGVMAIWQMRGVYHHHRAGDEKLRMGRPVAPSLHV